MRTETAVVTVYQDPDTCQNVRVEYQIERGDECQWILHKVKVIDDITLEPDDLKTDIVEAIAFEEYIPSNYLELECEIQANITSQLIRI